MCQMMQCLLELKVKALVMALRNKKPGEHVLMNINLFFKHVFIEISLTYNMLVSDVQHNDFIFLHIGKWSPHKSKLTLSPYIMLTEKNKTHNLNIEPYIFYLMHKIGDFSLGHSISNNSETALKRKGGSQDK